MTRNAVFVIVISVKNKKCWVFLTLEKVSTEGAGSESPACYLKYDHFSLLVESVLRSHAVRRLVGTSN